MHHLTSFCLRHTGIAVALLLAITVGLGAGIPRIEKGYGFRVLVGDDHPAIRDLDALVEEYAGGSPTLIAWACGPGLPCEHALDAASLGMAADLTHELMRLPSVRAVQGPANASLLVPGEDGFAVRHLVEGGVLPPDHAALVRRALDDPLWRNTFVSKDGLVGAIAVQPPDNRPETMVESFDAIEATLEPFRSAGFEFHLVGDAPGSVIGGRDLVTSMNQLVPLLVALIGAVLLYSTRSWQQTLATLAATGLALLWALGVLGWLHWPQDSMLEVLAPIVLVVGVCDAMHLLARYAALRASAPDDDVTASLVGAARDAGPACLITTLTTVVAFLSFATSALDTFLRFGVIAAFGVAACLVLSFSLAPMLLRGLPGEAPRVDRASHAWNAVMDAITDTAAKHSTTLLACSAVILVFFGWGATHLRVDQNWLEAYGEQSRFVQSVRFIEEHLGHSESLELDIALPDGTRLEDPGTLQRIETLEARLETLPGVSGTTSVATLIGRMNRLMNGDDPAYEHVAERAEQNAELLEILGFDDPETLGRWVSLDRQKFRISVDSLDIPHLQKIRLTEQIISILESSLPEDWDVALTGEMGIDYACVGDVQATQLQSFPMAFVLVFALVAVFLRSWKLGLAALVPTLLPVVLVLGLMGWAGLSLDLARAMIAAVVIGIGVDDAIHVLAHYQKKREAGLDPRAAMHAALRHTGRAVVTTSFALALGFLALMLSAWQTIASFGLLVSVAILGALAASLFVLPAIVFAFAGDPNRRPAAHGVRTGMRREAT